jgi:S-adenosylmethionine:tRNA ribosyltransferase-isomerase
MISTISDDQIRHARFRDLPRFLKPGDLLVINTSATLNAALNARRQDGTEVKVHLSTHLPSGLWSLEVRRIEGISTEPLYTAQAGELLILEGGGRVQLLRPHRSNHNYNHSLKSRRRLWLAALKLPFPFYSYIDRYGAPIHYKYVRKEWPLSYYQTVFATEPGSAEMPSAGRAFTPELITSLVSLGVGFAPLLLHTGVASLEKDEPPYDEFYRVPETTAEAVNDARKEGRRVIAVGTTVVRALETVDAPGGRLHPGEGWTDLVITPQRGLHTVDGLLTGLHEPRSSHLAMLIALAGRMHIAASYRDAMQERLLWHEFGDLHLILP